MRCHVRLLGLASSALLVAVALLAAAAPAGAAPSGSIASVTSGAAGAAPGGTLPLTVTVRSTGGRLAARVVVRLTTGRRVVALKGVTTATVSGRRVLRITARLPKRLAVGGYRVAACLSPPGPRTCRTARRPLEVFTFRTSGRKPLTVRRTLDPSRASSALIGPQGGTLETTAGDGSRAVLTIPAGALTIETRITMTPVTALDGHPQKPGLLAGVSITPDGTRLLKPATLVLTPTRATAPIQRVVLTGDGQGGDTHADLFRTAGTGARIDLVHFSSYELTFVGKTDYRGQLAILDWKKYPPSEIDIDALRAELVRRLQTERQRELLGLPDGTDLDLEAALRAHFEQAIKSKLIQARTNCEVAPVALIEAHTWARQVELLGLEKRLAAEIAFYETSATTIMEEGLECLDRRCTVQGYPEAFLDILTLQRIAQLRGIRPRSDIGDTLRRCLRFQLELDSEIRLRYDSPDSGLGGPDSGGFTVIVHGEQPLDPYDLTTGRFAPVPLNVQYASVTGRRDIGLALGMCAGTEVVTPRGGTPGVVRVRIDELHINDTVISPRPRRLQDELTSLTLGFESGDPFDTASGPFETYFYDGSGVSCPVNPVASGPTDENHWARFFSAAHAGERESSDNYFLRIENFVRGTNPIFLTTSYVREGVYSSIPYSEITTIRLRHIPIPPPPKP